MILGQLLNENPATQLNLEINDLTLDSRQVKPGSLFFAYQGTHLDGRKFIADAMQKGARAILLDAENFKIEWQGSVPIISMPNLQKKVGEMAARFYGYPAKSMRMNGVTGTNGKTSCSHFIAASLQQLNVPCGVIGTLGSGMYGNLTAGSLTTPDAVTLQKIFAKLHAEGAEAIAMEVSSHSLDQGRINGTEFEVGIFTNLTQDHLDYHGTMAAYGAAKKRLFEYSKNAVINVDDPFGREIAKEIKAKEIKERTVKENVFGYSITDTHHNLSLPIIKAEQIQSSLSGMRANVVTPWGEGVLNTQLVGQFNLSNLLATLTTLCVLKMPFKDALQVMPSLKSIPGRMETLGGENQPLVIVDYAHTPDALEKTLSALRQHCHGKLYCVFGCGGDRDRSKRPIMAKIVEQLADRVIVTDDNPRTENSQQIVADIMQGFSEPNKIIVQQDRSKAIYDVIQYASVGDCILVAGKGAETYQQIGNEKIPFQDVEEVMESLYARLA